MANTRRRPLAIVLRGALYFAQVFAVGFVLGVGRVLWLVPRVGERVAELIEAPLMLAAIVLSARFVTARFVSRAALDNLISGGLALVLLLSVEFSVVLGLRGLTVEEYLAQRDPITGSVYVVMLISFAVMPWLAARRLAADRAAARIDSPSR